MHASSFLGPIDIDLPGVAVVEFSGGFHVSTPIYGHAGSWIGWPEADTPVPESDNTGSVQRQGSAARWRFLVAPALLNLGHVSRDQGDGTIKEQTMKLARVGVIAAAILAVASGGVDPEAGLLGHVDT